MSAPAEPVCRSIRYGEALLEYWIVSRERPVQRVQIKVHPDCRVEVYAPATASLEDVHRAVQQRIRWVYQQVSQFQVQREHVRPRQYVSGESHYYLGKRYVLKVMESPDEVQQVKLLRGKIEVRVRMRKDVTVVRRLLEEWYRSRAKDVFKRRLEAIAPQALWLKEMPLVRVQNMQKQWGSCSPSGRISLNPNLVKARRECIDYVILHELCHIAEHNHGERFYRLLGQVMPSWESVKSELDAKAGELFV